MTASRAVSRVLGSTTYRTSSEPGPEPPEVIVTHDALLEAVQLHPPPVFSEKDPVPPTNVNDRSVGDAVNVHPGVGDGPGGGGGVGAGGVGAGVGAGAGGGAGVVRLA